ncbi:hypothetical protein JCM5353_002163 [Sporobolomyces roseus]
MSPFSSTRPHARNPNDTVTGHKLVESILRFVEEIEITDPSLNVVVAGTGNVMALLWSKALAESSPPGSDLQGYLMEATTHTLKETVIGHAAAIHLYVWPKGKSDEHWSEADHVVKSILRDGKEDEETGDIVGVYPREPKGLAIEYVEHPLRSEAYHADQIVSSVTRYEVTVSSCPDANTRLSLRRSARNSTIPINLANPAPCIVYNLARLATGNWTRDPEHHLRVTTEWSTLVLFSKIISTFERLDHPLPKAFAPVKPDQMCENEFIYQFVQGWTRKQIHDRSNEEAIGDTCRVLSRYLGESWKEGNASTKDRSQVIPGSSIFTPTSRHSARPETPSIPLYRRMFNMMP